MTTTPERAIDPVLQALEGGSRPRDQQEIHGCRLYDHILSKDLTEIPEIMAAVGETHGPILEVAPGSGRLTWHLRSLRREVALGEVGTACAALVETYGCVVLGASYATLLEPRRRRMLFREVSRGLAPGGRFLMTVVNADHRAEEETINGGTTISQLGEDAFLITVESRDALNGARHLNMSYVSFNECGTYRSSEYTSDIALVSTELLEEELNAEGLSVLERRPIAVVPESADIQELYLWVCARNQQGQTDVKDRP
ncbi:class I SAM-dependent methyltransferase [Paenarthrobacter nicotinovorans]|uniref:class I SAM-dependent methyltransferase n=1 Tax=Paenarthrobacter nicotinovorans TaxID=29320 RepID=UPI00166C6D67|nr:class I SAM-dependent methyltransferase [Paenarthrobacter nicotinovorans]MBP2395267.1 hypothetical protein [Paenarthrobacter nicotinovorans]UKE98593.1 class I SAM-dependent methyltransferase [Paenarthrobacter nicotinovorans]UKF03381.1 class I SAM-dependent methyltransferase [Paenarthrobacter nicotinovorans]GGV43477.1 hypothetical protein GCM10010212_35840 [Paenarthrobacter nicotinovorans]